MVNDANPSDYRHPEVKVLTDVSRGALSDFPVVRTVDRPELEVGRVLNSDEVRQLRADKIIPA